MKNVAIIIPSLEGGGAERVAGYLSKYLSQQYNVYIFLRYINRVKYEYGGTLVPMSEAGDGKELSTEVALRILKGKYKIDIAISFMENCNFANIISKGNEKVVVSERSSYRQKTPRKLIAESKIISLYNKADAIVACSYGVKQSLIQDYGVSADKTYTIYNFLNKEMYCNMAAEQMEKDVESFLDGSDYFISVGRLHPLKRMDYIIEQFIDYEKRNDLSMRLLIIGEGGEKEKLEKILSEKDANEFIRIIPSTINPFLYIARAKALLVASEYEGMPNVILESFSLGIPVISTDCFSGPRELLEGEEDYAKQYVYPKVCKRGILVNSTVNDTDTNNSDLQQAMNMMCNDGELNSRMKRNIEEYMEEYSNQNILRDWISVLEEKCDKKTEEELASAKYEEENVRVLKNAESIYIFGTGVYAKRAYNTYAEEYTISGFLSSYMEEETSMYNTRIYDIDEIQIKETDCIILGVGEEYEDEVCDLLKKRGCPNIVYVY